MRSFILILVFPITAFCQKSENLYFDQSLPGKNPQLFSPGIISDEFGNRDFALSPDGNELFFTLVQKSAKLTVTIMHSKKENGVWSTPACAAFSGRYHDIEPAFSPDGKRLYFSSVRPLTGESQKDFDIWFVTKQNGEWSDPQNPGYPLNTEKNEFYPSITKNGSIYFTRKMDGADEDIVVCTQNSNGYNPAVSLPGAINTTGAEFNAFVDPDEQYILFTGDKRSNNYGNGDLFISKKDHQENWSVAVNLGEKINKPGMNYCPYVSPDKKFLFFVSNRTTDANESTENQKILNGSDNIYWMLADEIIGVK